MVWSKYKIFFPRFNGMCAFLIGLLVRYLCKVVLLVVRASLVTVIELVIISCPKIQISITSVLPTLLVGFHCLWKILKNATTTKENTNRQDYGKEKLIKNVLQMPWNIIGIQLQTVHSKHNMQNGTNIQLCLLDHFRNKFLFMFPLLYSTSSYINFRNWKFENVQWTFLKGHDFLRASYVRAIWTSSCMGS